MIYFINKNKRRPYTREEEVWLNQTRQKAPDAIAVMHPQWRGIRSSTENLFDCCLYVGDSVDDFENLDVFASLLLESGCSKIVFSGFAKSFGPLALHLKKTNSTLLLYCLWHGNFMQSNEEYNWEQFKLVLQMTRAHTIHKWGFVKEGMAEMMEKKFGIKTAFVKNYVKHIRFNNRRNRAKTGHLGHFIQLEKKPLCHARSLLSGSTVKGFLLWPRQQNKRLHFYLWHPCLLPGKSSSAG
jgi:hypothetical protein